MTASILSVAAFLVVMGALWLYVRYGRETDNDRLYAEFAKEGFDRLADYNHECGRGLVHTAELEREMRGVQHRFDVWTRTHAIPSTPKAVRRKREPL